MAAGHIKRAVQSGGGLPLESSLALERQLQAKLFASDDAREGLSPLDSISSKSVDTADACR